MRPGRNEDVEANSIIIIIIRTASAAAAAAQGALCGKLWV